MRSPWPPSWWGWVTRRCACISRGVFSNQRAPAVVPAATAATTWNGCAALADLVAAGVNLAGVAIVLDLQDAIARLQSDLNAVRLPSPDSPQAAFTPHGRKRPDNHVKRR